MPHSETQGIYAKKGIYWLQLPMVRGSRPKPITLQTRDLKDAIDRAAQVRGLPSLKISAGISGEILRFLKFKTDRRAYSTSTAQVMKYRLEAFAKWVPEKVSIHQVTKAHLQQFYDKTLAKHTPATAHKALMAVRPLFRWLLQVEKQVRSNPAIGVLEESVPDRPRVRFCSRSLQDKLIEECPREDLKLVLMLGFHAGLRKNEINQAVPGWFHFDRCCIDMQPTATMPFNKHKKPRVIPMRAKLLDFLQVYGLREPFMLRPEVTQGKNLYRYNFGVALKKYVKAQGVPWVTAHVLRHTFASLLVQDNTSVFKVAQWLGDSVSTTEKHYAHLTTNDDDIELS